METFDLNNLMTPRTRVGLVKLYLQIIKDKPNYRFDPKWMIFDVLPGKGDLYKVFMPNSEYSISQSKEDNGHLDISEHRFINYLKFTEFTQTEIDTIFDTFENTKTTLPANWAYSIGELYNFLRNATECEFSLPLDAADGVPILTDEDLEKLYAK